MSTCVRMMCKYMWEDEFLKSVKVDTVEGMYTL